MRERLTLLGVIAVTLAVFASGFETGRYLERTRTRLASHAPIQDNPAGSGRAANIAAQPSTRRSAPEAAATPPASEPTPLAAKGLPAGSADDSRAASPPVPADAPPASDAVINAPAVADALADLRSRNLQVPVSGVRVEQLAPSFDQARGTTRRHEALDIMASRGTPVVAVEAGLIERLFDSKQGGLTIYQFDPTRQYAYYYAHLDRYAAGIHQGGVVQRGDVIGYVGSTGNARKDAPHLHFGIFILGEERRWWDGTPLDPYLVWH